MRHCSQGQIEVRCGRSHPAALYSVAFSVLFGVCGNAQAALVNARSASLKDVAASVASATDGDTVVVPAGTATWTTRLTISKAITLQGAGIGETIILEDLTADEPMLSFNTALGKLYRLTGFEFRRGSRTEKFGKGCVLFYGTTRTFRLDHCKFDGLNNRSTYFRNAVCGVLDHNVFISRRSTQITIFHEAWDGKSWGDGSWAKPIDWGGSGAIYIEDNDFSTEAPNPEALIDEYAGARFVFRHNKITNGVIASHGTGSTGRYRGVRQWEIYNNTFIAKPHTAKNAIHMRGGTGVVFSNTLTGFAKFVTLHTYRYHTAFRNWGGSDGTSGWDLNDTNVYASGIAGPGSGIGPNGTGGILVVPGAGWQANQWIGYAVRNLDGLSNIQQKGSGRRHGPGAFFSTIVSNTGDTIIARNGSQQPNKIFAVGDRFEIRRATQSLDMIGASTGELLSGNAPSPRWLNQTIEPVYVWNNTKDGAPNASIAIAHPPIIEGVHFFNNQSKPGYKPFVYPHPLVNRESSAAQLP